MRSRAVVAALATVACVGLAGCGGSGTSSASSSSSTSSSGASSSGQSAAVCGAAEDMRASLDALGKVDVSSQGVDGLQQAFSDVKTSLSELAGVAKAQYAEEVRQVQTDATAVQTAADAAKANTTAATVGAVATAVRVFAQDAQALVKAVGSSC
jgi:TolA-binding protein